jgi:hypothetical protein
MAARDERVSVSVSTQGKTVYGSDLDHWLR